MCIRNTGSRKSWESMGNNTDLCFSNSVLADSGVVCTMFVSEMWSELLSARCRIPI